MSRGRLDALTDGLFAIAMTILVLELHAPDLPAGAGAQAFEEALRRQWPSLTGYVASFALLGLFWYLHHWLTHGLRRIDAPFFAANLVFLLLAASFPYTLTLMLRLRAVGDGGLTLLPYFICLGGLLVSLAAMCLLAIHRDLLAPHAPVELLRQRGLNWLITGLCLLALALLRRQAAPLLPYLWIPFLAAFLLRHWRRRKARASASA
ncbi:MAG TPA: TMEM175 family protein [Holophagaceae bacterium]|nr:TMEM175 family protein [Holophagaceae bacterium]